MYIIQKNVVFDNKTIITRSQKKITLCLHIHSLDMPRYSEPSMMIFGSCTNTKLFCSIQIMHDKLLSKVSECWFGGFEFRIKSGAVLTQQHKVFQSSVKSMYYETCMWVLHGSGVDFLEIWKLPRKTSILFCQNYGFPLVDLPLIEFCPVIIFFGVIICTKLCSCFFLQKNTNSIPAVIIMHNISDSADQKLCLLENRINIL